MQRQEAVEEGREALTESAAVRSERLSSETRAEVAREFRKTLNRSRPSRKRYSVSSAHYSRQQSSNSSLEASGQFSTLTHSTRGNPQYSGSQFDGEENPFISSTDGSQFGEGGVSLGALEGGGEAIYREFEEHDSLSKFTNTLKKIVPQPIRVSLLPPRSWRDCRRFFFAHIPILQWLWTYRPNQLVGDLIAGITIGVTHIPQGKKDCSIIVYCQRVSIGIGFALLANLPPVYGLYSSFIPVIVYSFFGSSRHISVGACPFHKYASYSLRLLSLTLSVFQWWIYSLTVKVLLLKLNDYIL